MNRLALVFSLGLGFAWSCANVSLEEILDGKACDEAGNCAEGYVCNTATMICVLPGGEGGEGPSTGGGGPSTGGAGTGGVADNGGGGAGATGGEGGSDLCPPLDDPPGGACPGICNGGCPGAKTCVINCTSANECPGVTCPAGFNCQVNCSAANACRSGTISCPSGNLGCGVSCTSADSACRDLVVQCASDGACGVSCGANAACNMVTLACGTGACTATCDSMAASKPTVENCNQSCNCNPTTCL